MSIIATTDFDKGATRISQTAQSKAQLGDFITTDRTNLYIQEMLGIDLGNALINDFAEGEKVPTSEIWLDVWNPFTFKFGCSVVHCVGIKQMILQRYYYDFNVTYNTSNFPIGQQSIKTEGTVLNVTIPVTIWNDFVTNAFNLYDYIEMNSDNYPNQIEQNYFEYLTNAL